jgi:hypothetical protein
MSVTQNESWLECAKENFDEALSQRNWAQARAVVEDIEGYGFDASELRREMNREMYESTRTRKVYPPQACSFSSLDCHEDDCSCNQFSDEFNVTITKTSLFGLSRAVATIISKEPKEMVWHKGSILITSLPSKAMAF